ncbi:histone deacetylase family protein [Hirschia baltica]|uniref:Histone deacetylase n=1 Tax=Hirschia baltica (strain ATCC 49814 / DSM 5838 / IFAM 1418) TaxID=582402 RepID=C6XQJ5_HIRBI|nr:histone deacetylase [Hirschia baltica]ACT58601.1 Histone deacetylase [Hirschia baltica ATCC 49814]
MLPIVHHPLYDASSVSDKHRFPMRKYSLLPLKLMEAGLAYPNSFHLPELASAEELSAAHSVQYVAAVLSGNLDRAAQKKLGFEWSIDVSNRARASAAGSLLAGKLALKHGAAANTAGGSHHAGYDYGAGFCVFNDVAVAVLNMLNAKLVERVLIVDLDVHHGDGSARIFANDQRVFTFSMHCEDNWPREKPPSDLDVGLAKGLEDEAYLAALKWSLCEALERSSPQIVFYNAGVDPHIEDRLGLLNLSDAGLQARDKWVANTCRDLGVPVVGVLGGGYSQSAEDVARRHVFMFEALNDIL